MEILEGEESFGTGSWEGEKKSEDPDHAFELYQYCRDEFGFSDLLSLFTGAERRLLLSHPHDHTCKNVGIIRSDDTNRPISDVGYEKGSVTFLDKQKCLNWMKVQCKVRGGKRPLPGGYCVENGWHPKK